MWEVTTGDLSEGLSFLSLSLRLTLHLGVMGRVSLGRGEARIIFRYYGQANFAAFKVLVL